MEVICYDGLEGETFEACNADHIRRFRCVCAGPYVDGLAIWSGIGTQEPVPSLDVGFSPA